MRGRFITVLFLLFLVGSVGLALLRLLLPPFEVVASITLSVPDVWEKLAAVHQVPPVGERQKPRALKVIAEPPRPASSAATKDLPTASEATDADLAGAASQKAALTIARISSDGPSVFGGTAAPFAQVTVRDGTTVVATATANDRGDWSLVTEYKFADTNPKISVRVDDASEKVAPAVSDTASPVTSGTTPADHIPPAVQLVKKFENLVAVAREEAKKHEVVASTLKDEVAHGSASAVLPPISPASTPVQPQATEGLLPASRPTSGTTILVPITFVYNEATLTPEGQGAARLLLEYLVLKKFVSVTLSGHADERGLPNYNMELSHQRLITVEHLLREGGYQGKLDLVPKGSIEPFTGIDRSKFPPDELYQLDRRVELRVAN